MTGWLLDTNLVSALRRGDRTASAFVASKPLARLFLSDVTLAEIRRGIEMQQDAAKRAALVRWLEHDVRPVFAGRSLPFARTCC